MKLYSDDHDNRELFKQMYAIAGALFAQRLMLVAMNPNPDQPVNLQHDMVLCAEIARDMLAICAAVDQITEEKADTKAGAAK